MNAAIKPSAVAVGTKYEHAIALPTADHKAVKGFFGEFEKLKEQKGADAKNVALEKQLCDALTVHTEIGVTVPGCTWSNSTIAFISVIAKHRHVERDQEDRPFRRIRGRSSTMDGDVPAMQR